MRNPKLVPYETIIKATSGEPEAVDEVLRHYSKRIRSASLESGHVNLFLRQRGQSGCKISVCEDNPLTAYHNRVLLVGGCKIFV